MPDFFKKDEATGKRYRSWLKKANTMMLTDVECSDPGSS